MTNSLDAAPDTGLERAFRLPEYVRADPELVQLYEDMVSRLREEASGLPMNTLQTLLIERIASFYVQIKHKENTNEFRLNQQKEFNTYWLNLTVEFNRLLAASDGRLREQLLLEITKIISEDLKLITDLEERKAVRQRIVADLSAIGV